MRWIYWFGWMLSRSVARSLLRLRVVNPELIKREGAVLVISNHESFLDPPLIGSLYDDEMVYLARKTLFVGIAKWLYAAWNAIPIDQERPEMGSMKSIIRKLREGHRVLVFPEGERTSTGELGRAQPGVGLIAVKAGVPIQPMRIRGAREALPRGSGRVHFARVEVTVGPVIDLKAEGLDQAKGREDYQKIADRMMRAIAEL